MPYLRLNNGKPRATLELQQCDPQLGEQDNVPLQIKVYTHNT